MAKFLAVDLIGNVSGICVAGEDLVLLPADDGRFYLPPDEKFELLDEVPEGSIYDFVEVKGGVVEGVLGTPDEIRNIVSEMAFRGLIYTPMEIRTFDGEKIDIIKVKLVLPNGTVYINDDKIPFLVKISNSIFENPFELQHEEV